MNIQQNSFVDKSDVMYSMATILKARMEPQALENDRPEPARPPSMVSETPTPGGEEETRLPTLGRYINVWA